MPLQKIQLRPGVNREGTTLSNEGGWFDCDKIRFRSGYPEKIGGWKAITFATFLGVCRSLWNWVTLGNYNLIGVGTNLKFYIYNGGTYNDITPLKQTGGTTTPANPFSTGYTTLNGGISATATTITLASGTNFVASNGRILIGTEQITYASLSGTTLLDCVRGVNGTTAAAHNTGANVASYIVIVVDGNAASLQQNDFVTFTGAATVAGLNLNNEYQIKSVVNTTTYTIDAGSTANASVTNGGGAGITAYYQINTGYPIYTIGTGWGTGPWSPTTPLTLGSNPVATTNGSSIITVTQTGHPYLANAFINISGVTAGGGSIGGIPVSLFNGTFQILGGANAPTANTYKIYAGNLIPGTLGVAVITATSSVSGGGSNVVVSPQSGSRAWGSGFTTGIGLQLRLWSQANFGQKLLFGPRGGGMYLYDPGSGTPLYSRATLISGTDVPAYVNDIMVSDATRITIAFGCNDLGVYASTTQDPMLIRWSAQESYTDWTPTATNQAGSYRLSHGSYIMGALQTRQEILVWTDAAVYSMQYLGPSYVYGFTLLADNISIASPNAVTTASGVTYWMGIDKFYVYSGRVETLPCAVRTYVYDDINMDQAFQFFASTNEGFSEVWWFYCSLSGPDGTNTRDNPNTVIDRYVIFNYLDRVWYYGTMGRTAWIDSGISQYPIAATYGGVLVNHENGIDDNSTPRPQPISCYVQSSDFDIGDGHNYGFVWQIIPDITFDGSVAAGSITTPTTYPTAQFTVRPRRNPGANYGTSDTPDVISTQNYFARTTYNVQQFTQTLNARLRGRQMAFRVSSNAIGTQWQLGTPRINVRPDGRK